MKSTVEGTSGHHLGCNLRDWGKLQCGQELPACSKEGLSRKPLPRLDGREEGVEEEATPSRERHMVQLLLKPAGHVFKHCHYRCPRRSVKMATWSPLLASDSRRRSLASTLRQKWQAEVLGTFVSKVCAICAVISHNQGPITSTVINIK